MSAVEVETKVEDGKQKKSEKSGEVLFCGGTDWDAIGRRKGPDGNLISPTRLRPLINVDIRFIASGCSSCHCVALDVEGRCYTWGRNEKGQLGHGDKLQRDRPTAVSALAKYKIVKAGAGRSHTVVITDEGHSLSFGWNKHGQLGSGSTKNETEPYPVRCLVSEVTTTACGGDFTVWLSAVEGASILTAGLPQYGQLGHGTDNEYNTKDSSVRLAYEAQPRPKAIASLSGEVIVKVACGTNHTVAVDSNGFVYTWGFGGYGRLGHREQKDEWVPRRVDVFQRQNVLPPNAVVSAGSANSACTAGGGQLYMWGKVKNAGDDWMYPKPLLDLSGWNLRCMDSGNMHFFVGADNSCISWGHAQYGELGYGPSGQKSSAVPKKVEILEGMHVISVACGMGHSMVIVDRTDAADQLDKLDIYDGEAAAEETETQQNKASAVKQTAKKNAKTSDKSRKKRKSKVSSDSEEEEVEEEEEEEEEDEEEEEADSDINSSGEEENGEVEIKRQRGKKGSRGRGRGSNQSATEGKGSGRGRGRGRPAKTSTQSSAVKTGKRGRPRKS